MKTQDYDQFRTLLADVHAFYRQDISAFSLNVWWEAMKPYDLVAVSHALNAHARNPDTGQFMPKPADVVKMLEGTTQDSAMQAWAKVDKALRMIGTHQSVVFDDPLIHAVLGDMGGWIYLGQKTEDEWPFVAKEFVTRYRGFKMRGEIPEFKRVLTGIADASNQKEGFKAQAPVLIGNVEKAKQVIAGGLDVVSIGFTPASRQVMAQLALPAGAAA
jgi:hypothetical protein